MGVREPAEQEKATVLLGQLAAVQGLIAGFPVAVPYNVSIYPRRGEVRILLHGAALRSMAAAFLSWVEVLTEVGADIYRSSESQVMVTGNGRSATGLAISVFVGAPFDPAVVGELAPDETRPVALDELRAWAAHPAEGVA